MRRRGDLLHRDKHRSGVKREGGNAYVREILSSFKAFKVFNEFKVF